MTRERNNNDLCTPEWIVDAVENVDLIALDPCSNPYRFCAAFEAHADVRIVRPA